MSQQRRPLPDVEDDVKVERGVGPVKRRAPSRSGAESSSAASSAAAEEVAGPAGPGLADEQTAAGQAPADPADPGPASAPDGTFTASANPGAAQLVPAAAVPAAAAPPPAGQSDHGPRQGPVYQVPPPDGRPRAEDIIRPREKTEREQISAMVPAELQLVRRMRLLWAHEGIEQRDQVALAVDAFLRSRGY